MDEDEAEERIQQGSAGKRRKVDQQANEDIAMFDANDQGERPIEEKGSKKVLTPSPPKVLFHLDR